MFSGMLEGLAVLAVLVAGTAASGPPLPHGAQRLSGFPWTIKSTNGTIDVPSSFPNQVHLALIDAGVIDEPNVGLNEGKRSLQASAGRS